MPDHPTNVAEYYQQVIGEPLEVDPEEVRTFTVYTECGSECVRTIDAGKSFLNFVSGAHGAHSEEARKVRELIRDTILVFMFG